METKEYLKRAGRAETHIRTLSAQIEHYRDLAEQCTQALTLASGGKTNNATSKVEQYAVMIADLQERVKREIEAYGKTVSEITSAIETCGKQEYIDTLKNRYLNGYTWERIADMMNCDLRTVYRWHGLALMRVKVPSK